MEHRAIHIRGQVQGVGFRPFVWRVARREGITGSVLNDASGVRITAEGDPAALERFIAALGSEHPPLARIDHLTWETGAVQGLPGFAIVQTEGGAARTRVTPDAAPCPSCLSQMQDPRDRRFLHPFITCTDCGPRFSILREIPYDRPNTTMAAFTMCPACEAEYDNPADRRFHAQPIACPRCGPTVWIEGETARDPIAHAADQLRAGRILCLKGLGGFHLAVDASNAAAVAELRGRKRRPGKPFALMAEDCGTIARHSHLTPVGAAALEGADAPIVLLPSPDHRLAPGIAPGQSTLGWMLPSSPLHHRLLATFGGPLVMTSANLSGEPQVITNEDALAKMAGIADTFLLHDREIARRLDDGVVRIMGEAPVTLRRGRGQAPSTLPLPPGFDGAPPVFAAGGHLKGAFCLTARREALLSHHLGDMDEPLTRAEYERAVADYTALFDHGAERAACDLHPDFFTTRYAEGTGLPLARVQHHHAHLAACLGENGWPRDGGKVAGIILDGLGLGPDGTVWGGDVILGDYDGFERRAFLQPAPLIGGDRAQSEPWRNALVRLDAAGLGHLADMLFPNAPREAARTAAARGLNAPLSSSVGRLFDAVAACLGLSPMRQSYEGEAAMRLEALAGKAEADTASPYPFPQRGPILETAPLFAAIADDLSRTVPAARVANRFHRGLARAFADSARTLLASGEARAVALSGGCFQNARLVEETRAALGDLPVLMHRHVPANDGGLAFGQALIAMAREMHSG
ncbi:MAG: carbamoyltransferase HypF [Rubricella sp.]